MRNFLYDGSYVARYTALLNNSELSKRYATKLITSFSITKVYFKFLMTLRLRGGIKNLCIYFCGKACNLRSI